MRSSSSSREGGAWWHVEGEAGGQLGVVGQADGLVDRVAQVAGREGEAVPGHGHGHLGQELLLRERVACKQHQHDKKQSRGRVLGGGGGLRATGEPTPLSVSVSVPVRGCGTCGGDGDHPGRRHGGVVDQAEGALALEVHQALQGVVVVHVGLARLEAHLQHHGTNKGGKLSCQHAKRRGRRACGAGVWCVVVP